MVFFSLLTIIYTTLSINEFTKTYSELFVIQGELVKQYIPESRNNAQDASIATGQQSTYIEKNIKNSENNYESKRYEFYKKIDLFIFYSMVLFLTTMAMIFYYCVKHNKRKLKNILLLVIFLSRFYKTLLSSQVALTVIAFGRIRKLSESLNCN